MKLYIKQKVFSWRDKFSITDEFGRDQYYAESEGFSFGKRLHLTDINGNELAYIYEKFMSFAPRYYISQYGQTVAEVVKEFSFFKPKYRIDGLGWRVEGDVFDHNYVLVDANGFTVATVSKAWLSWGDAYEIDMAEVADPVITLAAVLVVDAVLEDLND
ncbi:MAG: LURP-one-related family protein [Clostridia bacterium]|nr:LURP-one-related family protein [Clostridia bacterium]